MVAASEHNPQQIPLLEKFVNSTTQGMDEEQQTNQDIQGELQEDQKYGIQHNNWIGDGEAQEEEAYDEQEYQHYEQQQ